MEEIFKPMLAHSVEDLESIPLPVMVSPKLDGIRVTVRDGIAYSRTNKPIRSKSVQELFGKEELNGLDGELIYGSPVAGDVFNLSTRFCMSENIPEGMTADEIRFYVFDDISEGKAIARYERYMSRCFNNEPSVVGVGQTLATSLEQVAEMQSEYEADGYEGAMVKCPNGEYKNGRSTVKQGLLGKLKKFVDSEARIIGFDELMHNNNQAEVNELGRTKRATNRENLIPADTMGALHVADIHSGVEFKIGTGFTAEQRKEIWDNRDSWLGLIAKYKFFPVGIKDKPRLPVYLGIRHEDDIGE